LLLITGVWLRFIFLLGKWIGVCVAAVMTYNFSI